MSCVNEKKGLSLPQGWKVESVPISTRSPDEAAVKRLKNYNADDVSIAVGGTIDGCVHSTYMPTIQ